MSGLTGLIQVVGMAASAFGQYQAGQDASKAAKYNASIARQQADMRQQQAQLEIERQRRQNELMKSRQVALYGKAGVKMTGSPLAVMDATATEMDMDTQIMKYNADVDSTRYRSEAAIADMDAGIYERTGTIKAGTTLLTQGGQMVSDYFYSKPKTNKKTY